MNLDMLGQVVVDTELLVDGARIEQLARAIGTPTAMHTTHDDSTSVRLSAVSFQ